MHVRLNKSFTVTDSPRPFLAGELVTVSDALGKKWVAEGRATELPAAVTNRPQAPVRRTREKAAQV